MRTVRLYNTFTQEVTYIKPKVISKSKFYCYTCYNSSRTILATKIYKYIIRRPERGEKRVFLPVCDNHAIPFQTLPEWIEVLEYPKPSTIWDERCLVRE